MCGIVALSGVEDVSKLVVRGLQRLQYRGYDSFGFGWLTESGNLQTLRRLDAVDELDQVLPATRVAVGHTRWATHGAVTLDHCHPQQGDGFCLVHNGIVENFLQLACEVGFGGDLDTQLICGLLDDAFMDLSESRATAMARVFTRLGGRNTLVVLFDDGEILGVRHGSPLILARAEGLVILASDLLSIAPFAAECYLLDDGDMVSIREQGSQLIRGDRSTYDIEWQAVTSLDDEVDRDGYPHFMLKEIMEQWQTLPRQLNNLVSLPEALKFDQVIVTGAGGAYIAASQIAWLLRNAGSRAFAIPAYEMLSARALFNDKSLVVAVSQSGETADTLSAASLCQRWGAQLVSLVNMPLSSLARMSDTSYQQHCGPEICVLSTKSATAQVMFGYQLAAGLLDVDCGEPVAGLAAALSRYLSQQVSTDIRVVAASIANREHLFVLGAGRYHAVAQMCALNIKEASYVHAEAFSSGELKHGVIALIEPGTPVIVYLEDEASISAAAEVKARGAHLIGIGHAPTIQCDDCIGIPTLPDPDLSAITAMIPGQLLAYHLGVLRGVNPDRPRNLAKSVTVS